ncbi:Hypothetical protein SRAE_X000169200 [Strongyloides ratti]|uniref:Uncharacterized protein n=1 Tax=Strongyloides ratti TaxID=34506 RepID=A0A090KRE0_STRRB|nr:Hypothetical protein SRAE_X000169200 [Strongyloides ratti]CEF59950.1 Hypothetical protein SRAE_X000169200 [Strongyloides ratti]
MRFICLKARKDGRKCLFIKILKNDKLEMLDIDKIGAWNRRELTLKSASLKVYFVNVKNALISPDAPNALELSTDKLVRERIDAL